MFLVGEERGGVGGPVCLKIKEIVGFILHEASATSDHDVLDIWERLELGRTDENRRSLPDGEVLKERVLARGSCSNGQVSTLIFVTTHRAHAIRTK